VNKDRVPVDDLWITGLVVHKPADILDRRCDALIPRAIKGVPRGSVPMVACSLASAWSCASVLS
jgi:hypothetical protein